MKKVFKYCCNGEVKFMRALSREDAIDRLRVVYLKRFGKFNLTDIKQLPIPERERNYGRVSTVS